MTYERDSYSIFCTLWESILGHFNIVFVRNRLETKMSTLLIKAAILTTFYGVRSSFSSSFKFIIKTSTNSLNSWIVELSLNKSRHGAISTYAVWTPRLVRRKWKCRQPAATARTSSTPSWELTDGRRPPRPRKVLVLKVTVLNY